MPSHQPHSMIIEINVKNALSILELVNPDIITSIMLLFSSFSLLSVHFPPNIVCVYEHR
jgi:hypothetical protein